MHLSLRRTTLRLTAMAALGAVLAAGAALTVGVVAVPVAGASPSGPPWEPDPSSVGGLTFYNSSGDVITGGNIDTSPVAAYVEGDATVRAGDTSATLYAYTPVSGQQPTEWSGKQLSLSTAYPNTSTGTPAALKASTLPVVTGSSTDLSLATYIKFFPNTNTPSGDYAHLYQLRLKTAADGIPLTATYDSADILVTSTNGTWSVDFTPAAVAVSTSPSAPVYGQSVTYSAAVTGAQGTPTGTVTFTEGGTTLCTTALDSGSGSCTSSAASIGKGKVTAAYTGDDTYFPQSGTASLTVAPASTSSTVTSSPTSSVYGQSVTFTDTVTATAPGGGTPTGTVQFTVDGTNVGSPVTLTSGVATYTPAASALPASSTPHVITAVYTTTTDFGGSTGTLAGGLTVGKASTSSTVTSVPTSSVYGQSVTFTDTVTATAPGGGTPTGTVQFTVDGTNVGSPVTLTSGVATYTPAASALPASSTPHVITAVYTTTADFGGSTGTLAGGLTVGKASTSSTVTSVPTSSVYGQSVTFTDTVTATAPGGGTPTGTVQFTVDGTNVGSPVTLTSGVATYETSALSVATHPVTAVYTTTTDFGGSTGTLAGGLTVGKASTSSAITSVPTSSVYGQSVTFTDTVTATAPGGGTPTGTVQFTVDGTNVGSPVTLTSGVATYETSALSVTTHPVTAVYGGDGTDFGGSTGTLAGGLTVGKASTSSAITSVPTSSVYGQSVTFTDTVTATAPGGGTPTGTVQFTVDGTNVGSPVTLTSGVATYTPAASALPASSTPHVITAVYTTTTDFGGSTGTLAGGLTVGKASTSSTVTSVPTSSVYGQSVTFTDTVTATAPGGGTPTGTVQFTVDGTNVGSPVTLTSGVATYTPAASALPASSTPHVITAVYSGGTDFGGSTGTLAGGLTVGKASTSSTVTSVPTSSVYGQSVTFTDTVTATAPGGGTPTGTVQFTVDGTNVGSPVTLTSGVATYETSALSVATHPVTAVYTTTTDFGGSTGTLAGGLTVGKASTSSTVTSVPTSSVYGQSVTFTDTVTATAPGGGTPTGTVQFTVDGTNVGSPVTLTSGVATYTPAASALPASSTPHVITAVYTTTTDFGGSTGTLAGGLTVGKASTSSTVTSSANPSVADSPVTFTDTVTATAPGGGTPTGTVQFTVDGTNVGSPVTLTSGVATYETSALSVATHPVTAVYGGDSNDVGSTGTLIDGQVVVTTPDAPTDATAVAGNTSATVSFTPGSSDGGVAITSFTVTAADVSDPANGGQTASGTESPISVTGLTNGDSYTFTVTATNGANLTSPASHPSSAVTPAAPAPPTPPAGATASQQASSSSPTGTATATLPGNSASATGTGAGSFTVSGYGGNPTSGTISGSTGGFFDLAVAPGSLFSSVSLTVCVPNVTSLSWWNGSAWVAFSQQSSSGGCVTATVTDTTSPTLDELTGTPVVAVTTPSPNSGTGSGSGSGSGSGTGYWEVASDGGIFSYGNAQFYGSTGGTTLNKPIVGIATTPDGKGYWLVASDGGVFAFGDAAFYGSTGGTTLNKPIVGIATTPDGKGYWLVASDGGVFAFGDAAFYGSTGGTTLNKPIVGIATTPDGKGYWLVASDGGVFAFGDAAFYGSTGGTTLNKPIVGIATTPDGKGYWLVASDGGVFAFGDAAFYGSTGGTTLNKPIVGIATTPDGKGYWLVASDGGVFAFGDAAFYGSTGSLTLNRPVVGLAGA